MTPALCHHAELRALQRGCPRPVLLALAQKALYHSSRLRHSACVCWNGWKGVFTADGRLITVYASRKPPSRRPRQIAWVRRERTLIIPVRNLARVRGACTWYARRHRRHVGSERPTLETR